MKIVFLLRFELMIISPLNQMSLYVLIIIYNYTCVCFAHHLVGIALQGCVPVRRVTDVQLRLPCSVPVLTGFVIPVRMGTFGQRSSVKWHTGID